jgi:uncharacterized membrane protein
MDNLFADIERHFRLPEVVEVPLLQPLEWVGAGWRDLRRMPGLSLSYGLAVAALMALVLSLGGERPYLFTASVSGFLLVGPVLAVGLYEISRRHGAGQPVTLHNALTGWRHNSSSIGLFAVMLALVAIGWERLSAIMFAMLYGGIVPDFSRFMQEVFISGDYPRLLAVYVMAGAALAAFVFAVSAVALPMMVDRDTDMPTAMMASLKACATNPAPMALWAALIVFFTMIGMLTFMAGMIVVMPLLGHATWHAYKGLIK